MVRGGYIQLGHWRGAPILLHITTPLGAWVVSGFNFAPMAWLGFFVLVLLHELGHALMVRKAGAWVQRLEILPIGGRCAWSGNVSPLARSCIAFAGVWMQLLLYIAVRVFLSYFGQKLPASVDPLITVLTSINLLMIAINLLPVEPLDGAEAWKVFPLLFKKGWRGIRQKQLEAKVAHLQGELDALEGKQQSSAERKRTYLN